MSILFDYTQIHIEISSRCTLRCPRCPRTELLPAGLNRDISLSEFQQAFPLETLANIKKIVFCGDIGDPIYAQDFLEICTYIKSTNVKLVIVTNGSYRKADWWVRLGEILSTQDQVTFSVDGWDQESNEKYRVNCNFDSIITGAKALRHSSQCYMVWSSIYFNFNEDHMSHIKDLAKKLGFDSFQTVKSSKFEGRYIVNGIDPLKPKNIASTLIYEKDITTLTYPVASVTSLPKKHNWAKCLNREKDLFISVDGIVMPCPWFNSGYQENTFIKQYQDKLSIKNRTLLDILEDAVWEEFLNKLDKDPLEICRLKCKNA